MSRSFGWADVVAMISETFREFPFPLAPLGEEASSSPPLSDPVPKPRREECAQTRPLAPSGRRSP